MTTVNVHIAATCSSSEGHVSYGIFSCELPLLCVAGPGPTDAIDSSMAELKGIQTVLEDLVQLESSPKLLMVHTQNQETVRRCSASRLKFAPDSLCALHGRIKKLYELCKKRGIEVDMVVDNNTTDPANIAAKVLAKTKKQPIPSREDFVATMVCAVSDAWDSFNEDTNHVWNDGPVKSAVMKALKNMMFSTHRGIKKKRKNMVIGVNKLGKCRIEEANENMQHENPVDLARKVDPGKELVIHTPSFVIMKKIADIHHRHFLKGSKGP